MWLKEEKKNSNTNKWQIQKAATTSRAEGEYSKKQQIWKNTPPLYSPLQPQAESQTSLERVNKQLANGEEICQKGGAQPGLWEQSTVGLRNLLEDEGRSELVHKIQGYVSETFTGVPAGRS